MAEIQKVSSKILRRRMATKLTRTQGLDAAVEMGEWSSRAMAKLYIDEEDALATSTFNPTDVMNDFGCAGEVEPEVAVAAPTTVVRVEHRLVEAQAQHTENLEHRLVEAQAQHAENIQQTLQQPVVGAGETLRSEVERMLQAARDGHAAPQARVPYGTLVVTAARQKARDEQAAVCCPYREGGPGPGGNPLKRKRLTVEVAEVIDSMAGKGPEEIKECLCTQLHVHTSRREIETFRQARFAKAGGRTAFIAAHC